MFVSQVEFRVNVVEEVKNWEEAIEIASIPLLKDECINQNYVEEVKENISKESYRFLVDHDIILAHSRPNEDVKQNGLSFLKINKGVKFPNIENKNIKLIFIISALNTRQHMSWLQEFATIMDDVNTVEELNNATTKDEIVDIFEKKINIVNL